MMYMIYEKLRGECQTNGNGECPHSLTSSSPDFQSISIQPFTGLNKDRYRSSMTL